AFGKPMLERDVLSLKPTEIAQPLSECFEKANGIRRRSRAKKPYLPLLLTFGSERRKRETQSEDEPDQPHGHPGWEGWWESSRRPRRRELTTKSLPRGLLAPRPCPPLPSPCPIRPGERSRRGIAVRPPAWPRLADAPAR